LPKDPRRALRSIMSIQPGTYRIKNAKSDTYLDASLRQQGQVHGWGSRPGENQKWRVEQGDGGYKIQNAETGEYLHADGPGNGTSVCCRGDPTEWDVQDRDGCHSIAISGTESVCDLDMGKPEDGTTVNIWYYTGARQQCWHFENQGGQGGGYGGGQQQGSQPQPQQYQQKGSQQQGGGQYTGAVPPGSYCIHNVNSGTAADLAGAGASDGTPITGWEVNGGSNQTWDLIPGQNGYLIKNSASGTYLGFQGAGQEGTMICGSSNPVEWQVNQADQGYSIRLAQNPSIVLDLAGGGSADGVKICLYSNHSGPNQQWKLQAK